MTHSDELVEREWRRYRKTIKCDEGEDWPDEKDLNENGARLDAMLRRTFEAGAALSALPSHELLREALDALDRQRVWHEGHDKTLSKQPPNTDVRWRRLEHQEQAEDARAAAEKIRAELEVG